MKGGWLEHEIRSLPQVLACSITKDDVVVLVQPSADPVSVERSVQELLRRSGVDRPIRVFGGSRPVFVEPVRVSRGRSAFVGTIGGAALLAAGVWIAGATAGLRGGTRSKETVAAMAPPIARQYVELPVIGGDGPAAPDPKDPLPPLLKPASSPIFGRSDGSANGSGGSSGPSRGKPPPSKPPTEPEPGSTSCTMPHEGRSMKEQKGGGYGPPAWSHSILVPAHCTGSPR